MLKNMGDKKSELNVIYKGGVVCLFIKVVYACRWETTGIKRPHNYWLSWKTFKFHSGIWALWCDTPVLFSRQQTCICVSLRVCDTCMRQQPSPFALTKRPVGILGIWKIRETKESQRGQGEVSESFIKWMNAVDCCTATSGSLATNQKPLIAPN